MISRISTWLLAGIVHGLLSVTLLAAECPPLASIAREPSEISAPLEPVCPPVADLQSPPQTQAQATNSRLDVNGDGLITPIDALMVINRLNAAWSATAGSPLAVSGQDSRLDTNHDGMITTQDVISIIEELNHLAATSRVAKLPADQPESSRSQPR